MVHPRLEEKFVSLERSKAPFLLPKPLNFDRELHREIGVFGVNRFRQQWAMAFDRSVYSHIPEKLSENKIRELRSGNFIVEVSKPKKPLRNSPIVRKFGLIRRPHEETYEISFHEREALEGAKKRIDDASRVALNLRNQLILAKATYDGERLSPKMLRLAKKPRERIKAAKEWAKRIRTLEIRLRRVGRIEAARIKALKTLKKHPYVRLLVQDNVVSFKGNWREPLSILGEVLRL